MRTNTSTDRTAARLAAIIATLFVLAVVLVGCSSGSDELASAGGAPIAEDVGGEDASGEVPGAGTSSTANRSVIVTGSMYMTVASPLEAAGKAASIVKDAGGRVDARDETAPDEWSGGSANLTLRIPSNQLDAVIEELGALGKVNQIETSASDVTNEVTDLDAHISTLRASTVRIEALLLEAKDITDIIKLEDELASRQAELESLSAQQRGLDDQVSLSTIVLSLTTVPIVTADEAPATFFDGLATGWNALVNFVSVGLVVLGALLPWLIIAAVISLVIVAIVRRRSAGADGPVPPAPDEEPIAAEATTSA